MKGFSKFVFVCGVLLVSMGLIIAITKGMMQDTYLQFKDDLLLNENMRGITEEEVEIRYADYKESDRQVTTAIQIGCLLLGIGCIAGALGIVYLDRAFKENERGDYKERYEGRSVM